MQRLQLDRKFYSRYTQYKSGGGKRVKGDNKSLNSEMFMENL